MDGASRVSASPCAPTISRSSSSSSMLQHREGRDHLDEGFVGSWLARRSIGRRGTLAASESRTGLECQARLADARFSGDEDELRSAGDAALHDAARQLTFPVPPDEAATRIRW